ncbi:hypothetical protein [Deinococcus sp.]|uniref:hypothetical protein n=1 Tax=Deinococcus sp. TaxID=47478 RepID=UPI003CC60985
MKRLVFLAPMLVIAACAPIQGTPPITYNASSSDILATVAQLCPALQPNSLYNYFSITSVSSNAVTCEAAPILAMQILSSTPNVSVTFTALQNGTASSVAGAMNWHDPRATNRDAVNKIFTELDKKFTRIQTP